MLQVTAEDGDVGRPIALAADGFGGRKAAVELYVVVAESKVFGRRVVSVTRALVGIVDALGDQIS